MQMKKIFLVLALVSSVVIARDVEKTASTKTKGERTVTVDTYTRAGATNLVVRKIFRKDENKTYTIQRVYHDDKIALEIWNMNDGLTFSAKSGLDFDVGTHFTPEGKLDAVNLMTTNLMIVDHFTVTNGLLYPVATSEITRSNEIGKDMKKLFDLENVKKSTPDEFVGQALDLMKKHKKK